MAIFTISLDDNDPGFWEDGGDDLYELGMDKDEFLNSFGVPDGIEGSAAAYFGDGLVVRFNGDEVAEVVFLASSIEGFEPAVCQTDKGVDACSTFREALRKHPHAIAVLGRDKSRAVVYRAGYFMFSGNELTQIGLSRSGVAGFPDFEPL
jgi:hypothetical protein